MGLFGKIFGKEEKKESCCCEMEIVELPGHPWFVGVQFHPELKSRPNKAHPLFRAFIAAAKENRSC